jgi:hypothetical protein
MSVTFFAPDAQAATETLEVNLSNTNAGQLTVALGLDTIEDINGRGMVAGEVPAEQLAQAAARLIGEGVSVYRITCLMALYDLAEAAKAHGSTVAWA